MKRIALILLLLAIPVLTGCSGRLCRKNNCDRPATSSFAPPPAAPNCCN